MNLQSQLTEGKRVQLVLRKSVQIKAVMCARGPAWHEVEGETVCSHWWQEIILQMVKIMKKDKLQVIWNSN